MRALSVPTLLLLAACGSDPLAGLGGLEPNTLELGAEVYRLDVAGAFVEGTRYRLVAREAEERAALDPGGSRVVVSTYGAPGTPWVQVVWGDCSNRDASGALDGTFEVDVEEAVDLERGEVRRGGRVRMSAAGDAWCGEARELRPYAFAVDRAL